MIKKFLVILLATSLFILLLTPACKAFVWDPTGIWVFSFNYPAYTNWSENLTLAGGQVLGFNFNNEISGTETGTYTLTGDFSLTINFNYMRSSVNDIWNLSFTSSEGNPNFMTGSGTVQYIGFYTDNVTVTAIKTTNLQ